MAVSVCGSSLAYNNTYIQNPGLVTIKGDLIYKEGDRIHSDEYLIFKLGIRIHSEGIIFVNKQNFL